MTFTPEIVTRTDSNNSTTSTSTSTWSGTPTNTTGFNSIILTINSNTESSAGGIKIKFSDTSSGTFTTLFSDTYLTPNTTFTKSYPIIKGYWQIDYSTVSSTDFTITSRLSTDLPNSNFNTSNTFDNAFESAQDAFGKLRVSNPYTLLDLRFPGRTGNTGTTEFLQNYLQASYYAPAGTTGTYANSKLNIQISGNSGTFISQSRNYCTYQPGKSLLFLMSAIMDYGFVATGNNNNTNGVISKVGYFDNYNGLYFSYTANGSGSGTCYVNLLNNSIVSVQIEQARWNIDKMDGTGLSGLTLNFTKAQLFVIDFEWLGVGRIRFGFYAYGRIYYCHEITNINGLNGVYMTCSNLPVRATLAGVDSGSSGNMAQICSTVISEGGYNPAGRPFAINSNSAYTTFPSGSEQILMMLSPGVNFGSNGNYSNQIILPTLVGVTTSGSNDFFLFRVRVFRDTPVDSITSTAFFWDNVGTNSVCQYFNFVTTPGDFALGYGNKSILVDSNYCFGKGVNSLDSLTNVFSTTVFQLTTNASGIPDVLVLSVENLGTSSIRAYGQLQWQEIY